MASESRNGGAVKEGQGETLEWMDMFTVLTIDGQNLSNGTLYTCPFIFLSVFPW